MKRRLWLWLNPVILMLGSCAPPRTGGELRFCLRAEPKTLNPLLVDDESS
jgi:hypothetical protein